MIERLAAEGEGPQRDEVRQEVEEGVGEGDSGGRGQVERVQVGEHGDEFGCWRRGRRDGESDGIDLAKKEGPQGAQRDVREGEVEAVEELDEVGVLCAKGVLPVIRCVAVFVVVILDTRSCQGRLDAMHLAPVTDVRPEQLPRRLVPERGRVPPVGKDVEEPDPEVVRQVRHVLEQETVVPARYIRRDDPSRDGEEAPDTLTRRCRPVEGLGDLLALDEFARAEPGAVSIAAVDGEGLVTVGDIGPAWWRRGAGGASPRVGVACAWR